MSFGVRWRRTAALAAAALALIATMASAPSAQAQAQISQIQQRAQSDLQRFGRDGFIPFGQPYYRRIAPGRIAEVYFRLRRGKTYRIVAACDFNCRNVDTAIYGSNRQEVDREVAVRRTSTTSVIPGYDDDFILKVKMTECFSQNCMFGVMILQKDYVR